MPHHRSRCERCGRPGGKKQPFIIINRVCTECLPKRERPEFQQKREFTTRGLADVFRGDPTKSEARFDRTLKALETEGWRFRRSIAVGPYVADFMDTRQKIAIELDGYVHRESRQRVHDQRRDAFFASQGVRVIRISSQLALMEPGAVLKALRNRLAAMRRPEVAA